jgi:acyl-CoA-dependent ceramide synthase
MEYVMVPFAEMGGIYKKKEKIRFAEQAWIFVYAGSSWSLGMVSTSPPPPPTSHV